METTSPGALEQGLQTRARGALWGLQTIAGSGGFDVVVLPKGHPRGGGAFFSHEGRLRAHLGADFAEKHKLTEAEEYFIHGHEIGHFLQFMQDPVAYKKIFEIIKEKSGGDQNLQKIWHRFFNTSMDIHDNAMVIRRSTVFQPGQPFGEVPERLYREKMWPSTDLSKGPRCTQLMDYCLRRMMVPSEELTVSPETRAALDTPVQFMGRTYPTLEAFVRENLFNPNESFTSAAFSMRYVIMPIFEKLLAQDIADGKAQPEPSTEFDIDEGMNPLDPSNFDDIDKYLNDRSKSAEDKAYDAAKKELEDKLRGKGYSEEEVQEMWDRRERTDPVAQNLRDLWQRLIKRSWGVVRTTQTGFKTGTPDLKAALTQIPILIRNPDKTTMMQRSYSEPGKETQQPRRIVLYLVMDASGSMQDNGAKQQNAKDVMYSLPASQVRFGAEETKNPEFMTSLETVGILYHSTATQVMHVKAGKDHLLTEADDEIMEGVVAYGRTSGGTVNNTGLTIALEHVKKDVASSKADDDVLRILMEVTDGDTAGVDDSVKTLAELEKLGVHTRGIRIDDNSAIHIKEEVTDEGQSTTEVEINEEAQAQARDRFTQMYPGKKGRRLPAIDQLNTTVFQLLDDIVEAA